MAEDEPEAKRRRVSTPRYISDLLRNPPRAIRHYIAPPVPDPLLGPAGRRRRRRDSWRDIPVSVDASPASSAPGSSFQHPLDLDPDGDAEAALAIPPVVTGPLTMEQVK